MEADRIRSACSEGITNPLPVAGTHAHHAARGRLEVERLPAEEGRPAPDFTLPSDTGEAVTLSSFRGAPVVLYFYPKDDTHFNYL